MASEFPIEMCSVSGQDVTVHSAPQLRRAVALILVLLACSFFKRNVAASQPLSYVAWLSLDAPL